MATRQASSPAGRFRSGQPAISARSVNSVETTRAPTSQSATTTRAAFGSSRGRVAPPPPKPPPPLVATTAFAALNGSHFTMSGQEDRRELLAEVDRDPRADPGQLAPRQRRDRKPEGALLHDRKPAAGQQLGD